MYAHVNTYRLGTEAETNDEIEYAAQERTSINDQTARTIASWWHSPSEHSRNITALSHGLPFDTEELHDEVLREITDLDHQAALLGWVDTLEAALLG